MPAAKKLTPQQQRDRRAKLMMIPLGVILLLVVAIELPTIMGGKKKPSAAPAASTTTTSTGATATTPASGTPAAAPAASPSGGLASFSVVATAQTGQLRSFSRLAPKDPFNPLVKTGVGSAPASSPSTSPPAKPGGGTSKPAASKPAVPPKAPSVTFTSKPTPVQTKPEGPMVLAAQVTVNGQKKTIPVGSTFPEQNPVFKLVAVGRKAIWISLVGGSFGDGNQALQILKGHPVKLVNTTAGSSYLIDLQNVKLVPKPAPVQTTTPTLPGLGTTSTTGTSTTATTTSSLLGG